MEIVFRCMAEGKRYYGVWRQGRELFVGTMPECDRYMAAHRDKLHEERRQDAMPMRSRPVAFRIFRSARA